VNSLVPTVRKALCDPLPEVRQAAAKTFDSLHSTVGVRALDDILPAMLNQLVCVCKIKVILILWQTVSGVVQSVLVSGTQPGPATNFSHCLFDYFFWQFRVCWCGAPYLTRSRVCTFQFLPGITRAAFLSSESHWTHKHSLLSLFLRLPKPGGPGSCIYFPQEQGSPIIPSDILFV
jgi:hypothetical protein